MRHQLYFGLFAIGGFANDFYKLIEIGKRDDVAFQRLGATLGLFQLETCATHNHFATVFDVAIDGIFQRQCLRPAVVDGEHIDAERCFELCMLVEVIDDHLGHRIALELDDHASVFIRFIAHGGDFRKDFFVRQFRHPANERGAIHIIRNFRDDDLLFAPAHFLHAEAATHFH